MKNILVTVILSFLARISTTVSQTVPTQCPVGWTEYGVRCYRVEVRQWVSYSEAQRSCDYRGATLAGLSDTSTTQFITNLLNATWSKSNQCLLQRRDCLIISSGNGSRVCSQQPCLSLWVGLSRQAPCGTPCSPGSDQARAGWTWTDGTPYNPSNTPWGSNQPVDDRLSVRFGPADSSMVMKLESYDELWRFGFVCSRLKTSTDYAGPEYPDEGLIVGRGDSDVNYNLHIGLAIGLSIGGALLIVIIAIIAVVIGECRSKPKIKKAEQVERRTDTLPVHYPTKRDTIYFNNAEYGANQYGENEAPPYGEYGQQDHEPPYRYPASEA